MEQAVLTFLTRRDVVAGLAVLAAPAVLAASDAYAQEKTLYERLGGVFAIAAVVDHFSDDIVKNPIVGQKSKNPQLREWHTKNLEGFPASSSCARCGFAKFLAGPSSLRPPSPALRRSALRRPTGTSRSRLRNSMRLQRNSDGRWTSSRFRKRKRTKSWGPSPPTRRR